MAKETKASLTEEVKELLGENSRLALLAHGLENEMTELYGDRKALGEFNDDLAKRLIDLTLEVAELNELTSDTYELVDELADRNENLTNQRQYLAQVLVAIAHYEGSNANIPRNLAWAAVEDFLPSSAPECDCDDPEVCELCPA